MRRTGITAKVAGKDDIIFLGEVAERTNRLELVCRKCDRRGVLSVAPRVREHGAGMLTRADAICPSCRGGSE